MPIRSHPLVPYQADGPQPPLIISITSSSASVAAPQALNPTLTHSELMSRTIHTSMSLSAVLASRHSCHVPRSCAQPYTPAHLNSTRYFLQAHAPPTWSSTVSPTPCFLATFAGSSTTRMTAPQRTSLDTSAAGVAPRLNAYLHVTALLEARRRYYPR